MSVLDDLRKDVTPGNWSSSDLPSALAYNKALDDVRIALRNPTDEQVEAAAQRLAHRIEYESWSALTEVQRDDWRVTIREAWAAAAGGDDTTKGRKRRRYGGWMKL